VPVAAEMKSDVLAPVLAAMNPEQAQKLTVRLANKLTLPDTNGSAPPPTASLPVGPVPAGVTANVPAPAAAVPAPKTGG